jgi:hypothetical protein
MRYRARWRSSANEDDRVASGECRFAETLSGTRRNAEMHRFEPGHFAVEDNLPTISAQMHLLYAEKVANCDCKRTAHAISGNAAAFPNLAAPIRRQASNSCSSV